MSLFGTVVTDPQQNTSWQLSPDSDSLHPLDLQRPGAMVPPVAMPSLVWYSMVLRSTGEVQAAALPTLDSRVEHMRWNTPSKLDVHHTSLLTAQCHYMNQQTDFGPFKRAEHRDSCLSLMTYKYTRCGHCARCFGFCSSACLRSR